MTTPLRFHRLHDNAVLPVRAHPTDAGLDLCAVAPGHIPSGGWKAIGTGLAMSLDPGYVGLIHPRSGLAARYGVTVLNTPGTVDADYRGEIKVLLINHSTEMFTISPGDRIAQLVIQRVDLCDPVEVDALDELGSTVRGEGGFGSTGR